MKVIGKLLQWWAAPVRRAQMLLALAALATVWLMAASTPLAEAQRKIEALTAATAEGVASKVPWEWDVAVGLQLAARLNLVALLLLLATAGWWLRPWMGPVVKALTIVRKSAANGPAGRSRWLVAALLGVVLLGTGLRLPLAQKSLWWDELWVIRQCTHGQWKEDPKAAEPGGLKFSPTTWKRCAFYYQKPTNHVPMALLQKTSLSLVQPWLGLPEGEFSDLVARLPTLLLSALSIALIGALLWTWGVPAGGVLAVALAFAVHPMAIRYGVDARGYALVLPLVVSALLAGTRLIRSAGRETLGWVWLGLNQCLWLWAFPHGLVDVLVMTLLLAWLLVRAQAENRDRFTVLRRLVLTHGLSGLLFVQLFLPNLMQARRWVGQENQGHQLDASILKDTISQVLTGLRWKEPGGGTHLPEGLVDAASLWGAPGLGAVMLCLIFGGLLLGLQTGWQRREPGTVLLAGLLASGALFACVSYGLGLYYYSRFAIALVPAVGLSLALGWTGLGQWRGRLAAALLALAAGAGLAGLPSLLQRPIEPVRDVTDYLRTMTDAGKTGRVLAYGHGREAVMVYLPLAEPVETVEQILAAQKAAKSQGQKLFLVVGHLSFNRSLLPQGFAVFEEPTRFKEVAQFNGLGLAHHYRVYEALR